MFRKENKRENNWLKRVVIALIAAIAGLIFARKTVLAPEPRSEYRLPPVPDVPPAGPEESTPLTEEEQQQFAANRAEAAAESGDVVGAIDESGEAGLGGSGESQPAGALGIAYEPAHRAAEEADAARASGTEEGRQLADQIDQRMYIGGAPAQAAPAEAETATSTETEPATNTATGSEESGPDSTSEGFDITSTEHGIDELAESEDLTDVGLDVESDLEGESDEDVSPDLTSEGLDTGRETAAGALEPGQSLTVEVPAPASSGEGFVRTSGDTHDCPEDYPIKGNANSRIYHKPGESSYDATIPEICFASEDIAVSMGFRARKR